LAKYALPENSYEELEALTRNAETVLQRLGIPIARVALSTGDWVSNAKTYDIEVWLPSQILSRDFACSNYEAFQHRRANIRFRRAGGQTGICAHLERVRPGSGTHLAGRAGEFSAAG